MNGKPGAFLPTRYTSTRLDRPTKVHRGKQIIALIFATMIGIALISQHPIFDVYASKTSPYDSGYSHGCDDAGISDPSDRYINQPEKGPSFHTGEFMSGYNDGLDSCSGGGGSDFRGDSGGRDNTGGRPNDIAKRRDACVEDGREDGAKSGSYTDTYDHDRANECYFGVRNEYEHAWVDRCIAAGRDVENVCMAPVE